MEDRLNPKNKGNARLLYIDGDSFECDICDEKGPGAIIDPPGIKKEITIHICKKCLEEIIKRFDGE